MRCSYLEIYNEEIRDLLGTDATAKMELREDPDKGVFVDGLTQASGSRGVLFMHTACLLGGHGHPEETLIHTSHPAQP